MTITLPRDLDFMNAVEFCKKMWELEEDKEYLFDFINLQFTEPFTLAYISIEMKRFAKSREGQCRAQRFEHLTYQAHMGFFRAFGLSHGKEPGEATGSSTYLPITILNIEELKEEAYDMGYEIGELLERKAEKIAEILTRQNSNELVETLTFSIREILRNVVEHSKSEIIEYCAQYWPSKYLVEVAIFDTGIGIKEGLSTNPFLEIENERDAIHMALLPSISGKMYKGVYIDKNNPWQNSGYGLYMTSRICRKGSDFIVLSNNSGLLFTSDEKIDVNCNYKGTALRLRIDTRNLSSCREMLAIFREEGEKKAKELNQEGVMIKASIASTMLKKDFKD